MHVCNQTRGDNILNFQHGTGTDPEIYQSLGLGLKLFFNLKGRLHQLKIHTIFIQVNVGVQHSKVNRCLYKMRKGLI